LLWVVNNPVLPIFVGSPALFSFVNNPVFPKGKGVLLMEELEELLDEEKELLELLELE